MKFKGLIMGIEEYTVTVLTRDNEYYKLKRKPTMFITQEIEFRQGEIINAMYYIKRLSLVAACIGFIITVLAISNVISFWNTSDGKVYAYISVDINPSIELAINQNQDVLNLRFIGNYRDDFTEDLSLEGMKINDALSEIIQYFRLNGLVSSTDENYILMVSALNDKNKYVKKNTVQAEKLIMGSLKDYKEKTISEYQNFNIYVLNSSINNRLYAKQHDISFGKYTIYTMINEIDSLPIDKIKEMPLNYFMKEYNELFGNHSDLEPVFEYNPINDDDESVLQEPTPTPELILTPAPTSTQEPISTSEATSKTEKKPTLEPTSKPIPTPKLTPIPTATPTPIPTQVPRITPTAPTSTTIPELSPTPTARPTFTARPTPTSTPTPMPTPTPIPTPIIIPTSTPTQLPPIPSPTPVSQHPGEVGTGLRGEYYDNIDLTNFVTTRVDTTIDFNWGMGAPHPDVRDDNSYSVRWTGKIKPSHTEMYTFFVTRDNGVRLWINDMLIINEWNDFWNVTNFGFIFLEADKMYDIRLEYYNNDGAGSIKLEWSSMSTPRAVVPQSALFLPETPFDLPKTMPGGGNGLKGEYYNDIVLNDLKNVFVDPVINFNWGFASPDKTINRDRFSIRWTGQIQPAYSEEHTFYVTRDNGVRLWIDGKLIIDQWNDMWNITNSAKIFLEAGKKYDIKIEYYKNMGVGIMRLEWSSPSMQRSIVPQSRLYSE
ncbi:UNVERIFIED_CONTAM: anti-sigma factor-like protein [Acetivibrio alkalicellulosi]